MKTTLEKFQEYLKKSTRDSESLKNWISQEKFLAEIEQLENKTTKFCEIYEDDAKNPTLFVFGSNKYIEEIEDTRFKRLLSQSSRTIKILKAAKQAKEKYNTQSLKISQIINELDTHSIQESHKYIAHILSLSHYYSWKIQQENDGIETDSKITIPNTFLLKQKERFNLDNMLSLYEDNQICIYLNAKNRLIAYFKSKDEFSIDDIKNSIFPALKEVLVFDVITLKEK